MNNIRVEKGPVRVNIVKPSQVWLIFKYMKKLILGKNLVVINNVGKTCSCGICVHTNIDTGEECCVCTWRGKAFPSSASVHVQERTHTGETSDKCKQYGKAFVLKTQPMALGLLVLLLKIALTSLQLDSVM